VEIEQVQYFVAIARLGSFSAAAEELYISQSSLSKQIGALERELGLQLIDRSKRKIVLTEAGETFLKHALQLTAEYQAMLSDLANYRAIPTVSIVAIPVIAQYGITAYLAQLKSAYPQLQVRLEEREASAILPALDSHQYDLAFVRDNYLDRERYACLEVSTDRFEVIVSKQHRYAGRSSIGLAELAAENFIMFDKGTVVHELAVEACRSAGFEPRIFYASLRVESVIGLVAQSIGVALMMERIFDYFQHPDVVAIPLHERIDSRLVLAYPKDRKLSHPAKIFVEFMRKTLREHARAEAKTPEIE
jgi:LysR family transcriptional regulator, transcription activator of glutamate synthase operon